MNETLFSRMYRSLSLLARRGFQGTSVFMRKTLYRRRLSTTTKTAYALFVSGFFVQAYAFQGYNVVLTTSPAVQTALLATATNQFLGTEIGNPFVANTYTINLTSLNPNYVAPGQVVPSLPCQLDQDIANMEATDVYISTSGYVYGFVDGMVYQQHSETNVVDYFSELCASATNFNLIQATTKTWNTATCQDVAVTIADQIFNLQASTPIVIPPEN